MFCAGSFGNDLWASFSNSPNTSVHKSINRSEFALTWKPLELQHAFSDLVSVLRKYFNVSEDFPFGLACRSYHLFWFLVISNERFATAIALTALPNMLSWVISDHALLSMSQTSIDRYIGTSISHLTLRKPHMQLFLTAPQNHWRFSVQHAQHRTSTKTDTSGFLKVGEGHIFSEVIGTKARGWQQYYKKSYLVFSNVFHRWFL